MAKSRARSVCRCAQTPWFQDRAVQSRLVMLRAERHGQKVALRAARRLVHRGCDGLLPSSVKPQIGGTARTRVRQPCPCAGALGARSALESTTYDCGLQISIMPIASSSLDPACVDSANARQTSIITTARRASISPLLIFPERLFKHVRNGPLRRICRRVFAANPDHFSHASTSKPAAACRPKMVASRPSSPPCSPLFISGSRRAICTLVRRVTFASSSIVASRA